MYFDLLKDHVIDWQFEDDDIINWGNIDHHFLRSSRPSLTEITEQEKRLQPFGYCFPDELKAFWQEVGCGYLCSTDYLDNGFEEPKTTLDIYLLEGDWSDVKLNCDIIAENELPFFRINNLNYLTIGLQKDVNLGKIYRSGEEIAPSLTVFVKSIMQNPLYYLEK